MEKKRNNVKTLGIQVTTVVSNAMEAMAILMSAIIVLSIKVVVMMINRQPPNQSLKLTEPAVNDFAARQYAENDMISRYVRATDYMELAVRRRSLAPVR